MNIIFLTISRINGISQRGIYADLMRKFRDEGHNVYIVSPYERQFDKDTSFNKVDGVHLLGVKTLNIQKTNIIEKGIGTILLERQFKSAIKNFLSNVTFDLILYSTPPITFTNVVKYIKRKNSKAISYLLLKDIFPQNAVDLGMFSKRSFLYFYFRQKEINLYKNSDYIGCMSPANMKYILEHNDFLCEEKIEVAPNSIELVENQEVIKKEEIRKRYSLPIDKPIFIYGGNLGRPQGIDFLIKCLNEIRGRKDCHFLIVGNGTEFGKLNSWYNKIKPKNISLFARLPKEDYDLLIQSCDIGLIFLDCRFTIPNYPSRLLSYLENKMPIIAATDDSTDIGTIAERNGYGFYCKSLNVVDFTVCVNNLLENPDTVKEMGAKGYQFLLENYLIENTYQTIISHINDKIYV